tara:strand:- start:305 stop:520 length:216 start_codon:yes stop_codon:yes gene_type:complete
MDIYQDNCYKQLNKKESYDNYGNYSIQIDITQIPLEVLNSLSYQEPYGRNSMVSMLSNSINDNIKFDTPLV